MQLATRTVPVAPLFASRIEAPDTEALLKPSARLYPTPQADRDEIRVRLRCTPYILGVTARQSRDHVGQPVLVRVRQWCLRIVAPLRLTAGRSSERWEWR